MFRAMHHPMPVGVAIASAVCAPCLAFARALTSVIVPICTCRCYLTVQLPTVLVAYCMRAAYKAGSCIGPADIVP